MFRSIQLSLLEFILISDIGAGEDPELSEKAVMGWVIFGKNKGFFLFERTKLLYKEFLFLVKFMNIEKFSSF